MAPQQQDVAGVAQQQANGGMVAQQQDDGGVAVQHQDGVGMAAQQQDDVGMPPQQLRGDFGIKYDAIGRALTWPSAWETYKVAIIPFGPQLYVEVFLLFLFVYHRVGNM